MKVVSAKEMARIETLAYAAGASEEAFMDSAGLKVAENVMTYASFNHGYDKAILLCGKGNNAGDAFVCGKELLKNGFSVCALHFCEPKASSPLCQKKAAEFEKSGGKIVVALDGEVHLESHHLLIDGLFGTGFKGMLDPLFSKIIQKANQSGNPIFAIDIPSGINGTTGEIGGIAIQAYMTIFLGLPKTGCFLGDAWNYVGKVRVENFGLKDSFIEQAKPDFILIDEVLAKSWLPRMKRNRHKYQAGYVVGLAGSAGMPGAPLLASYACLRTGAGIVRLLHPHEMTCELSGSPYELIKESYDWGDSEKAAEILNRASAVFLGPGLGRQAQMKEFFKQVLPKITKKSVIDADALNMIAENNLAFPQQTIITPHHGEMLRLLHQEKWEGTQIDFHNTCQSFAQKYQLTLVLKGSPTFVFSQEEVPFMNIRGNPGMATAGSGDVLTGIIAALVAQQLPLKEAAALGVYLHGVAGEICAHEKTAHGMIAGDIIEALPKAFKQLIKNKPTNFNP